VIRDYWAGGKSFQIIIDGGEKQVIDKEMQLLNQTVLVRIWALGSPENMVFVSGCDARCVYRWIFSRKTL